MSYGGRPEDLANAGYITDWEAEAERMCDNCGGEGYLDITDGDGSDWQEDTCADAPGTLIKCRICKGKGLL